MSNEMTDAWTLSDSWRRIAAGDRKDGDEFTANRVEACADALDELADRLRGEAALRAAQDAAIAPVAGGAVRLNPEPILSDFGVWTCVIDIGPHEAAIQCHSNFKHVALARANIVAAALAQDRASQGEAAGVPEADLIDAAMSVLNDNNGKIGKRKFRADATAVVRRVLRMLAAAPSAPAQGAEREVSR